MKEILLLNLTRMGDILQKTPLVVGLKQKHPGARVTVAVSKDFAAVCEGMPFIDRLVTLDKDALRRAFAGADRSPSEKYRLLEEALAPLREVSYDLAINLTHSRLSALLTRIIPCKEVRGITMDPEGYRVILHPWMNYFFCAVVNRRMNTFNLVDMYKKAEDLPDSAPRRLLLTIPRDASDWADNLLRAQGIGPEALLIALQPGASRGNRCWPPEAYGELADRLIGELGARILLVGGPGEEGMGEAIRRRMKGPAIDGIGHTTLMQLAAVLSRCRVLVCPDTGPMHLATAVGARVVALFMSTAYYPETGPYGEGHYVLQADLPCLPCHFLSACHHRVCREAITVEAVARTVVLALQEPREASSLPDGSPWKGLLLLRSECDPDGMLCYRPLIRRPLDPEGFLALLYRACWRRVLDGPRRTMAEECQDLARWAKTVWEAGHRLPDLLESAVRSLAELRDLAGEGEVLSEILLSSLTAAPEQGRLREVCDRLEAIDYRVFGLGEAVPAMGPLTTMFRYAKENLQEAPAAVLAEQTRARYRDLAHWIAELECLLRGVTALWGWRVPAEPAHGGGKAGGERPLAIGCRR